MPKPFVALLKSVFAKLVGAKAVKQEFVNTSFWSGLPAKFRARKNSKVSQTEKAFFYYYSDYFILYKQISIDSFTNDLF